MKMRLIDAEAPKKDFCQNCIEKAKCKDRETVCTEKSDFLDALDNVRTIEAVPVKHGTWIEKKPSRMKWIPDESDGITEEETTIEDMVEQKCSACQRWSIKFAHHIEMNFCPNCGAKMDGDGT